MKNKFRMSGLALVLALLLAVAGSNGVSAQGETETNAPGSWASSINLQNLEDSNNSITINFYNSAGGLAFQHPDTLTPRQGKSYYLPALSGLGNGQYSAMVSGTGELKAVVNSESANPNTGYSYNGIGGTEVATTLYFPGLYKNYYGFNSEVVLQNPNGSAASVTLSFRHGTDAAIPINASIPANSSRVFSLGDLAALASGNAQGSYSLVVTSSSGQELAGIANIWTAAARGEAASYNAFTSGSTTAYAPGLYKNYYNFVSALTVQNISSTETATGTVTYSNGTVSTFSLLPGAQAEFFQPNNPGLPSGNQSGYFSARVDSSAPVVTLVSIEDKIKGLIASYNGASSPATSSINVPVALKSYYGYFSAITVQNVGTQATNITVTFATGQSRTVNNIPANGTFNFIQLDGNNDPLPPNTATSAVVSSSNNQPLVAVVQENNPTRYAQVGGGDFLFAYTASPRP